MGAIVLRAGLSAAVLAAFVQHSAHASLPLPQASSGLPLSLPQPVPASSTPAEDSHVVVSDPRHRGILIEVPATEAEAAADGGVDRLYRKLVRTSASAGANTVVAENGRIFFVRAGSSTFAAVPQAPAPVAVIIPPEVPVELPLALEIIPARDEAVREEVRPVEVVALKIDDPLPMPLPEAPRAPLHVEEALPSHARRSEAAETVERGDLDLADLGTLHAGLETALVEDRAKEAAAPIEIPPLAGPFEPDAPLQVTFGADAIAGAAEALRLDAPPGASAHAHAVVAIESRGAVRLTASEADDWIVG
jgi:hypothetical protein